MTIFKKKKKETKIKKAVKYIKKHPGETGLIGLLFGTAVVEGLNLVGTIKNSKEIKKVKEEVERHSSEIMDVVTSIETIEEMIEFPDEEYDGYDDDEEDEDEEDELDDEAGVLISTNLGKLIKEAVEESGVVIPVE